jgi:CheY-like chemotaxis protein
MQVDGAVKHILVVDDEEAVCYVFERYLAAVGYRVSCASDGAQALRMQASDPARLVITDFRMPGMNGDELVKRLRAADPGLPIILLSANLVDIGPGLDGVPVFAKPVSIPKLVAVIGGMIGPVQQSTPSQDSPGR